jgi:ubiquinone/menaquinone biosynthesis C-methylase UbiE
MREIDWWIKMPQNFSELMDFYDKFQDKLFDYDKEVEIINNVLKESSAKKICDVGCGTGAHLIRLSELGYECFGIDKSTGMLKKAEEKDRTKGVTIKFIKADIRDSNSLKDWYGEFDAILWIRDTLSSIIDMEIALRVQHNLLKEGGIILFDVLQAEGNIHEREVLNMDVDRVKNIVRLNNFKIYEQKVEYDFVYFIQEKGTLKMVADSMSFPLINLEDILKIIKDIGFKYERTIYEYSTIPGTKSTMILARKDEVNNE